MKKRVLIVVDYQKDFVNGVLAVPGAETIAKNIQREIEKDYFNVDNPVVMIMKTVFNGVTIKIRHAVYEVKQDMNHVMFKLNGDQIECSPIK